MPFALASTNRAEFWDAAFGDSRNKVEPFSCPWEGLTFRQERTGFFVTVPFLHLTSVCKWRNGTKTKQKILNKPSSLVWGFYISQEPQTQPPCNVTPWRAIGSRPTTQETANNVINTARVTVHGPQGLKITLPKPFVEILTGTVAKHC